MTGWQTKMVLAMGLVLTIAAAAQDNKPSPNPTALQPAIAVPTLPPPPTLAPRFVPIPSGNVPQRVLTLIPSPPVAPSFSRPEPIGERHSVPAKVELTDGTQLTGDFYSDGPLQGAALFGPISISLNQIRGIDWQVQTDQTQSDQNEPHQAQPDRKAKVVLTNDDSLTMTLTMPAIQLKTSWGYAVVELNKVRSLVLTAEKHKWEDTPLGRQLVPDRD